MRNLTSKDKDGNILINGEYKICNVPVNYSGSVCRESCIINIMIKQLYDLEHRKGDNKGKWVDVDTAIPAFDKQIVKVKVADYAQDYETEGYYNHREQVWYDKNGNCLNDNVYEWYMILAK